ncbi:hypothetical protein DH2020_047924 [Rehmannia glutinosa]|uniref:VQ domain-containing protein n=1 Tax=Rehmannia glutinosa TaxID=99300 RepID=A0ABR0U7B8_REHGL
MCNFFYFFFLKENVEFSRRPNTPPPFVQADTSTFKQVVQMLTGSSETAKQASAPPFRGGGTGSIPPIKSTGQKKQGFKLYERRNSLKNGLMINTLSPGFSQNCSGFLARKPEILSRSILDFPSLVLSPMMPLNVDYLSQSTAAAAPTNGRGEGDCGEEVLFSSVAEKDLFEPVWKLSVLPMCPKNPKFNSKSYKHLCVSKEFQKA